MDDAQPDLPRPCPILSVASMRFGAEFSSVTGLTYFVDELTHLSNQVFEFLITYPFYVILRGLSASEAPDFLIDLICSLERSEQCKEKISFEKIEINPEAANISSTGTHVSRSSDALEPHTDSSSILRPHEIVAFQFVRTDLLGGESVLIPLDDLIENLDDNIVQCLQMPIFPFGGGNFPIISNRNGRYSIRYYRKQIVKSSGGDLRSFPHQNKIIEALDRALAPVDNNFRFHATLSLVRIPIPTV